MGRPLPGPRALGWRSVRPGVGRDVAPRKGARVGCSSKGESSCCDLGEVGKCARENVTQHVSRVLWSYGRPLAGAHPFVLLVHGRRWGVPKVQCLARIDQAVHERAHGGAAGAQQPQSRSTAQSPVAMASWLRRVAVWCPLLASAAGWRAPLELWGGPFSTQWRYARRTWQGQQNGPKWRRTRTVCCRCTMRLSRARVRMW